MDILEEVDNFFNGQKTFGEFVETLSKLKLDDYNDEKFNIDELYDELYQVKKKLRLLINNKNQLYKNCQPQIEEADYPSIEQLKNDFIRYIAILIKFEKECQRKSMPTVEKCPYCDTQIEPNDENCSMCDEPVENMPVPDNSCKRKSLNNSINNDVKRSKIDNVHLPNDININGENEKIDANNTSKMEVMEAKNGKETTYKNMKILHDILNKNTNQWICKSCECLNQFSSTNCQACDTHYKMIGYWICCHCSCVNEMSTDICSACNNNNELIVLANKWKCWKPVCNELNDDKFIFCHKCGLQRTPPVVFSDLIERKVQGKIIKLWICEKCWQYNNDKSQSCAKKCCKEPRFKQTSKLTQEKNIKNDDSDLNLNKKRAVLYTSEITHDNTNNILNENDGSKDEGTREKHSNIDRNVWICKKCTVHNPNENNKCLVCESSNIVEIEWKCWKKKCEKMNKIEHNYCQKCKLDRNPPDPVTKLVNSYIGNKMKEIWICRKCEKYNPKDKVKCEGNNCGAFRFYTSNDCKGDKNKAANRKEIKTNPIQWTCNECTFINNGNEKCCTICKAKRNDNFNCENNDICQTSNSWKCWFVNCKYFNNNQYKFCENCKLDRFGCNDRGACVKCQDNNGIKDVWICQKCFKYNSLSNEICGGKYCNYSRF